MARIREEVDLPTLLSSIRSDPKYKMFKKVVQVAEERLNLEKDRKAIFALHAARTSRSLYGKKAYSPSSIMDASANDMQARSEIVQIRMKAASQLEHLNDAMDAIRDHIMTEYNEEVQKYSTESQRKALVARVQRVARELATEGKEFLNLCDRIIEDIDRASFHLTHLTELTKLLSGGRAL